MGITRTQNSTAYRAYEYKLRNTAAGSYTQLNKSSLHGLHYHADHLLADEDKHGSIYNER